MCPVNPTYKKIRQHTLKEKWKLEQQQVHISIYLHFFVDRPRFFKRFSKETNGYL